LIALKQALYDAVFENTLGISRVAVAFSGGVDSSLLAKLCHHLRKQVTLLTIGFPGSPDIGFSKAMASIMGMNHKVLEINYCDFQEKLQHIRRIINCSNTSHIENCAAYYYVSDLAKQNDLDIVLSANGCDELFCGYDKYRKVYCAGEAQIMRLMEGSLVNEFALIGEINIVTTILGIQVKQPFLSPKFIEFAKGVPIDQKIEGSDDMIRKHILRRAALAVGVPREAAMKPKKALQYGSSIHKYFKRVNRTKNTIAKKDSF
jgi:asparagine synthase (glutamine-hydrolysing)